ncbi:hypothetical protein TNCV_4331151 [Trichonephila clavipes]|nr:hypothetical protein TNCV_4331151 [Trichonephila clavipes]
MHKEEKSFVKEKKEKVAASPVEKVTKKTTEKQKNSAYSSSAAAKSPSEYMREYRARKKRLQNIILMPSLRDGNAIETLLMTTPTNTDFLNCSVPSTTDLSTSLVNVGTDASESIVNSILRYKDYDSHKKCSQRFSKAIR